MEIASLETLHIAHVLEHIALGYMTGRDCNHWRTRVFGNKDHPSTANVHCYFYWFEFQKRGTLHLHMLPLLHNNAMTCANLEEEEPLLIYTAQGGPFRRKKLSVINGSPEQQRTKTTLNI